ncbi:DUF5682 family protein [Nocardia sp. CNY236]|uniref:DUF5682 family protein n=1 Tax=Nocardia sp. CNY236 TaxID=1169152 RepID=UPI0004180156|nr:DUF5682 family protein [Nocardia sp. CNY236]
MNSGAAPDPTTKVFGIRHHGPGSARSLQLALDAFRPDAILVEGPADADPLVGLVAAEGMTPPVALLAYVPHAPSTAAFWPYAVFSPEWQALRYAADHDVPVRFCDLPAAISLATEVEPNDRFDPLATLAEAGGYDDAERWWDAVVESAPDAGVFDAIAEAMGTLREHAGPAEHTAVEIVDDSGPAVSIDPHTVRREAHMRQCMRAALANGATRLAVVCGAWHAPALAGTLGPAAPDARLLAGLPKTKAVLTWVPWTHSRLSTTSGYSAGIASPGWYHHLFTETEQPLTRWLTRVAAVLRARDLPVSSAHIIESVRLADTLATLRGRPLAGLSEVVEATRSVLCGGDETMLQLVVSELVVGEALGAVPEQTPTVALEADLRAAIRSLRLKLEPQARTLNLDLRKKNAVARSRLLHRLRVLGIDWGRPTSNGDPRATNTFRESWILQWQPDYAISIIEASRWGTTLRAAAEAKILDSTSGPDVTVVALIGAVRTALLSDLGGAVDGLISRLDSIAALDHDVTHLLAALPDLVRTLQYGDARGTDTTALARTTDGLLVRICAGLPAAVSGLDTDAATELRPQLDLAHTAVHIRDDEWATREWLATLRRIVDREDVHGVLVGRAVRLLADSGRMDDAESARRLAAALSVGNPAAAKAAWIDGFLGGRGLVLVHDRALLGFIDDWLRRLDENSFVDTLPLLRRTFGGFESGERRAIGQAVRDSGSVTTAGAGLVDIDERRAAIAIRTAAEILGART